MYEPKGASLGRSSQKWQRRRSNLLFFPFGGIAVVSDLAGCLGM